ncbi:P-loop containing nucleoside triphosphate hydrolase protein [Scheffersomyces xylosifermentans]|uniref:P-loop containing nucleoside triphosphate hydrolase protein n=1 Tax=Scheffersomyces xylosifermentans TaxID=1304137 RepID=UPI00315D2A89
MAPHYPALVCGPSAILHPMGPHKENAFNPCFITWIIGAYAGIFAVFGAYSLYNIRKKHTKYGTYLPKDTGFNHYIRVNSVLLHGILFVYLSSFNSIHDRFADQKILAFAAITSTLLFVILPLHFVETSHKPIPTDCLLLFWPLFILIQLVLFFQDNYTNWPVIKSIDYSGQIKVIEVFLILNSISIFVMEYSTYWRPNKELVLQYTKDGRADKLSEPNAIEVITFSWMNELIMTSYKNQTVTETELPHPPDQVSTVLNAMRLSKFWNNSSSTENSLTMAIVKAFGSLFLLSFGYELGSRLLNFAMPQFLRLFIKFFDIDRPPILEGFSIAFAMFGVGFIQTIFFNEYLLKNLELGLGVRASLTSLIYQKSLKLSSESRLKVSSGDIINLMSVDVNRMQNVCQNISTVILAPTDIVMCILSLWPLLGKATLASIGTMLVLIPLNSVILKYSRKLNKTQMKLKDNRSRIINEILVSIKSIKLYAWEKPMLTKLRDSRNNKELKNLRKIRMVNQCVSLVWNLIPFLVSFTSFATFALTQDIPLTSEIVFPALAVLNLLSGPLLQFPAVITNIIEASVAIGRIKDFLTSTEIDESFRNHLLVSINAGEESVNIKNTSFLWSRGNYRDSEVDSSKYALRNINFSVKKGEMSCVVGKVGSGKSSLLYSLLGQLITVKGEGEQEPIIDIFGKVAYCAQQPWIMNASVKENILFGCRYEKEFYEITIEACQLLPDLEVLPDGDDTQVGEKGVSLSGGQKARLALARAVYARADIYLLDDVLSAVDSHVGKKIIQKVLSKPEGLLANKTIILCTNSISVLNYANTVTLLENGTIIEKSSPSEINDEHPKLFELISEFGKSASETPSVTEINNDLPNIAASSSADSVILDEADLKTENEISPTFSTETLRRASIETFNWDPLKKLLPNLRSGQLNEVSQKGKVKWSVYLAYARACSISGVVTWFLLLILASVVSVGGTYWLKYWTEKNSKSGKNVDVWKFITIYAVFGLSASTMSVIRGSVMMLWLAINASTTIHDQMATRILRAPMDFFERTPVGRIMNRFTNDINRVDDSIPGVFQGFIAQSISATITFVVIGYVMPFYIAVIIVLSSAYIYYDIFYIALSRELKRLVSISRSPIYGHLGESLNGIDTIRAYKQTGRFDFINNANVDCNLQSVYMLRSINRWLMFRLQIIGALGVLSAAFLAISTVLTGSPLSSSMAGFIMTYALDVTGSLKSMVRSSAEVETSIVSVERCLEYSTLPVEEDEDTSKLIVPPLQWPSDGVIEFNDYSTRYRANLDLILRNITMHINSGEKVGIVGRTGAGKSSLALSIFRIIEPVTGNINIDGLNTSGISLYDLRHRLSIIPQDSQLLEGTIRQNLDPFNYYTDEEVWKALDLAHLKNHVLALEENEGETPDSKLECKVFEGGSNFSSGQRQLMSLARVLLKMNQAKVLVLDEATAAVDVQTDKIIQETIRSEFKDKTIITIAHRLETVMDSDRIVSLDKGLLKEFDTPQNLLSREDSIFYSLCKQGGYI